MKKPHEIHHQDLVCFSFVSPFLPTHNWRIIVSLIIFVTEDFKCSNELPQLLRPRFSEANKMALSGKCYLGTTSVDDLYHKRMIRI